MAAAIPRKERLVMVVIVSVNSDADKTLQEKKRWQTDSRFCWAAPQSGLLKRELARTVNHGSQPRASAGARFFDCGKFL
jgi:hypothetical protein